MKPKIDISGQMFGRLKAVEHVGNGVWLCECACGNQHKADGTALRNGRIQSCGCLHKELLIKSSTRHGGCKDRLYKIWQDMKYRCFCKTGNRYKDYGGRGITVCNEWLEYESFKEWAMSSGYDPNAPFGKCTLDRIDVNGNYEPSNCRWVDYHVQALNRRSIKKPWKRHAVRRIDSEGNTIDSYASVTEASNATGCSVNGIIAVCSGRQCTTNGMVWQYAIESRGA